MRLMPGIIQKLPFGRGQAPYVLQRHAILIGGDADGENDSLTEQNSHDRVLAGVEAGSAIDAVNNIIYLTICWRQEAPDLCALLRGNPVRRAPLEHRVRIKIVGKDAR